MPVVTSRVYMRSRDINELPGIRTQHSVLWIPACSALSLPCGLSALPCMHMAGENATERGTRPSLHPPGPQLLPPIHCHSLPLSNMDFKPCLSQIIKCSAPKRSLTGSMRALSVGFLLTPLSLERRSQQPRPGRLPRDTECHPHWTQSSAKCRRCEEAWPQGQQQGQGGEP